MSENIDFTYEGYKQLLETAKEAHIFRSYEDYSKDELFILWRHDVDCDLENALTLAEIESTNDVAATYFVLLRNVHYNLFEKRSLYLLKEIIRGGHQVGLHFDCHFYDSYRLDDVEKFLGKEKEILEDLTENAVKVFSFHNPTPEILEMQLKSYAGMHNTYSSYFREEVAYASDSNGYWRHDSIIKVIRENPNRGVQVLTHPIWWQQEAIPPKQRMHKFIDEQAEKRKSDYNAALKSFGRENKTD